MRNVGRTPASLLLPLVLLAGCHGAGGDDSHSAAFSDTLYAPRYATGFCILGDTGRHSTLLQCRDPWQGAHGVTRQLLMLRHGETTPPGYAGQVVVADSLTRLACLSTSHVAMLALLHEQSRLVAFTGVNLICDSATRQRLDADPGCIAELGYEGDLDYERLLQARPQLVMLYGLCEPSPLEKRLEQLAIPYVYIGDYVEQLPLGKSEWIVAVGELLGRRGEASDTLSAIARCYEALWMRASLCSFLPAVMLNTPYADAWYMPSATSCMARLIRDAAGRYLYERDTGSRSATIDIEEAALLAARADVWLQVGQMTALDELRRALPTFADLPCVRNGQVYNSTKRRTPEGGNDYWESGAVRADRVLRDLAIILHPGWVPGETYYFERLR